MQTAAAVNLLDRRVCGFGVAALLLLGGYLVSVEFVLVMYVGSHVYPEKPPLSEVLPELFLDPFVLGGAVLLGTVSLVGAVGGGALAERS